MLKKGGGRKMFMIVTFNFKNKEIEEAYEEYKSARNKLIRLLSNEQIEAKEAASESQCD